MGVTMRGSGPKKDPLTCAHSWEKTWEDTGEKDPETWVDLCREYWVCRHCKERRDEDPDAGSWAGVIFVCLILLVSALMICDALFR